MRINVQAHHHSSADVMAETTGEQLRWPLSVQCQVLVCKRTCCLHGTSHSSTSLFPSCPVPTPSLRAPRALEPVSGRPSEVRCSLKSVCPCELTLRTLSRLSCCYFVMPPPTPPPTHPPPPPLALTSSLLVPSSPYRRTTSSLKDSADIRNKKSESHQRPMHLKQPINTHTHTPRVSKMCVVVLFTEVCRACY